MPRMVRHDALGPYKIEPQEKPIFICGCGLSQNLPYCDGAHKTCRITEQPGMMYVYDKDRRTIIESRQEEP